jgi:cell division initiation protein
MRITSLEIKQHEFERSFRGYNVDEVNHFLGNIAQEWDRMLNELKMLKMQLDIAEKEASKLKEVEMTLIKTLKTAEDTSAKITETANLEASKTLNDANYNAKKTIEDADFRSRKTLEDATTQAKKALDDANYEANKLVSEAKANANKTIEDAKNEASQLLKDAENNSKLMVSEAENKVQNIQKTADQELAELDAKYNALESKRNSLLGQLKSYNNELSKLLDNPDIIAVPLTTSEVITESAPTEVLESEVKEELEEIRTIPELIIEQPKAIDFFEETKEQEEDFSTGVSIPSAVNAINIESSQEDKTNLEVIEGIGPKIKEVLNNAGIKDFRSLATTPEYRLRDILTAAGSHFAAHDPSTWNEQALLAENGNWEKLEALKDSLIAGRTPKEEESSHVDGSNTEEMLDKVNKVKAAIRKAMIEKTESPAVEETKPKSSGSFFDSI